MVWALTAVFVVLGALAFRPTRWAYFTFVALGLLFFPARVGFHFHPQPCECALSVPLALFSLTNYGHIWRFAIFFLMTSARSLGRSPPYALEICSAISRQVRRRRPLTQEYGFADIDGRQPRALTLADV